MPSTPSLKPSSARSRKRGFKHYYLKGLLDVDPETGCWIFLGRQSDSGYGLINRKRPDGHWVSVTAQRHFFELYRYKLLPGHDAGHRCHRRCCVNPHHLKDVTKAENAADWYIDQKFSAAQREQVSLMLAADLPISVIADRMCAPRPYILRLARELAWRKYQTSFDFADEEPA